MPSVENSDLMSAEPTSNISTFTKTALLDSIWHLLAFYLNHTVKKYEKVTLKFLHNVTINPRKKNSAGGLKWRLGAAGIKSGTGSFNTDSRMSLIMCQVGVYQTILCILGQASTYYYCNY
jgi:hypothetical protein